jgi:hypothetical protein
MPDPSGFRVRSEEWAVEGASAGVLEFDAIRERL